MTKVGISGANGTMGRLTIAAIEAVDDMAVGGLYAPGRDVSAENVFGMGARRSAASWDDNYARVLLGEHHRLECGPAHRPKAATA